MEAMKLMNEIESDVAGEIVKKLVATMASRLSTGRNCSRSGQEINVDTP